MKVVKIITKEFFVELIIFCTGLAVMMTKWFAEIFIRVKLK